MSWPVPVLKNLANCYRYTGSQERCQECTHGVLRRIGPKPYLSAMAMPVPRPMYQRTI